MKEQILSLGVQFILSVLGVVGTYILFVIKNYIDEKKKAIIASGKAEQYNHALSIANGLFVLLEGEFAGIGKAGLTKKSEMEKRILEVIPELSQTELDSINKQVWQELKDKVVTPIITPINTDVQPAPQAEEVKPVESQAVVEQPQA